MIAAFIILNIVHTTTGLYYDVSVVQIYCRRPFSNVKHFFTVSTSFIQKKPKEAHIKRLLLIVCL